MLSCGCAGLAYAARAADDESCVYAMHFAMGVTFRHQLASSLHAAGADAAHSVTRSVQKENDDAENDGLLSSAMAGVTLGGGSDGRPGGPKARAVYGSRKPLQSRNTHSDAECAASTSASAGSARVVPSDGELFPTSKGRSCWAGWVRAMGSALPREGMAVLGVAYDHTTEQMLLSTMQRGGGCGMRRVRVCGAQFFARLEELDAILTANEASLRIPPQELTTKAGT